MSAACGVFPHQLATADEQTALITIEAPDPDLTGYDVITVSVSGGKDSQTALRKLVRACIRQGVPLSRVVVVFADLGEESEWPQAPELAAYHAAYYGLRFISVCKQTRDGKGGGTRAQGLLERIEVRGDWPSPKQRWCTSDFKRGPIKTVITRLVREIRVGRTREQNRQPVRVLSVMGLRAQESAERASMTPFTPRDDVNSRRVVDEWQPIHSWTTGQVWRDILTSKVNHHYAYDLGMGRLSCTMCIYAPRHQLVRAARANLRQSAAHAATEQRMCARKIIFTVVWAHMWAPILGAGVMPGPAAWLLFKRNWRTAGWFRKDFSITSVYLEARDLGPIRSEEIPALEAADGWAA